MNLAEFSADVLPKIEIELQRVINGLGNDPYNALHGMLAYHLGWEGEGAGEKAQGKRIRPLLVLLSTMAAGRDWQKALPAAAAVELIHNFSLIHDDIEDRSEFRHGRKTIWAIWGEPQAINTGDCMFSLAFEAIVQSVNSPQNVISAVDLLQKTCVEVTKGQYLDMSYEKEDDLPLDAYWKMVGGKTAALLACSAAIGATLTGAEKGIIKTLYDFAWNLGLAFQAQDDWLGIWGDSALTGKSTESDLMNGKKSLPVILGLSASKDFSNRWNNRPFSTEDLRILTDILVQSGVQQKVEKEATRLTGLAKIGLNSLSVQDDSINVLLELSDKLINRNK
ncbi:MAG TPA: polyprenyl synthetase family protein [Leptolinea sp.]